MNGASIRTQLEAMSRARIFFAHQSVGEDILEGLAQLSRNEGIDPVPVLELSPGAPIPEATLGHASVGRNTDPGSKLRAFAAHLRALATNPPDIALMKFCYVDFNPSSDGETLFREYTQTLDALAEALPSVRFLHTTVPLKARWLTPKERIKLLLGKSLWEDETNAVRERFNQLVRQRYSAKQIVDIARIESTFPDGSPCSTRVNGAAAPSMVPGYSRDGGHLNASGQRRVAGAFAQIVGDALEAGGS